jgi:hypothetical protein
MYPPTTAAVTAPFFTNTVTDTEDDEVPTAAVIVTAIEIVNVQLVKRVEEKYQD